MRRVRTAALAAILLASAAGAGIVSQAGGSGEPASAAARYNPNEQECRFLDLINDYRAKNGKGRLRLSATLGAAADFHSEDMARRNYFSHKVKTGGRTWEQNIRDFGYKGSPVAENIAASTKGDDAQVALKMWIKSKPHRKNMLNGSFEVIGIGQARDANSKYEYYWTTTFGGDDDDTDAGLC
jgi:uncharacterized protein YkwD